MSVIDQELNQKQLDERLKNTIDALLNRASSPTLAVSACAVCGATASGKHYGVTSCEGCKGFFKRYVRSVMSQGADNAKINRCTNPINPGGCIITKATRNQCQECRLNKCLDAGMKANHIQQPRSWTSSSADPLCYGTTSNYSNVTAVHGLPLPSRNGNGYHQNHHQMVDGTNIANNIPRKRRRMEVEKGLLPVFLEVVVHETEHVPTASASNSVHQSYSNNDEMTFDEDEVELGEPQVKIERLEYEDTLGGAQDKFEQLESGDTLGGAQVKVEQFESEEVVERGQVKIQRLRLGGAKKNNEYDNQVIEQRRCSQKNPETATRKLQPKKGAPGVVISKEGVKFQYPLPTSLIPLPPCEASVTEIFRLGVKVNLLVTWAVGLPAVKNHFTSEEKLVLLNNCWKDLFLLRLVQIGAFQDTIDGVINQQYFNKEAQNLRKFIDDGMRFQLSDFEFASLNAMKLFNFESIQEYPQLQEMVETFHHQTCSEYVDRSEMFRGRLSNAYTKKVLYLKSQLQLISAEHVKLMFFGDCFDIQVLIQGIIQVNDRRK